MSRSPTSLSPHYDALLRAPTWQRAVVTVSATGEVQTDRLWHLLNDPRVCA